MIARTRDDIEKYKIHELANRFDFAVKMAEVWFDKLESLSDDMRKELTEMLDGKTAIGEFVGSPEHQHLVKYTRVGLIFYALVENDSDETCLPCGMAFAFFKRFGLDVVHISSLGNFNNYYSLCDKLEETFKQVAKSPIAQDEEGNVLYFVKKSPDGAEELNVLSLCKLKTLEYRVFRKMREKLRGFYKGENPTKDKFEQLTKNYVKESKEFLEDGKNELPQPIEYYGRIFAGAFPYIQ